MTSRKILIVKATMYTNSIATTMRMENLNLDCPIKESRVCY